MRRASSGLVLIVLAIGLGCENRSVSVSPPPIAPPPVVAPPVVAPVPMVAPPLAAGVSTAVVAIENVPATSDFDTKAVSLYLEAKDLMSTHNIASRLVGSSAARAINSSNVREYENELRNYSATIDKQHKAYLELRRNIPATPGVLACDKAVATFLAFSKSVQEKTFTPIAAVLNDTSLDREGKIAKVTAAIAGDVTGEEALVKQALTDARIKLFEEQELFFRRASKELKK